MSSVGSGGQVGGEQGPWGNPGVFSSELQSRIHGLWPVSDTDLIRVAGRSPRI